MLKSSLVDVEVPLNVISVSPTGISSFVAKTFVSAENSVPVKFIPLPAVLVVPPEGLSSTAQALVFFVKVNFLSLE